MKMKSNDVTSFAGGGLVGKALGSFQYFSLMNS